MSAIIRFIKGEPVAVAAVLSAAVSVAVASGIGQGEAGGIAAAVEVILGLLARSQVSPVA